MGWPSRAFALPLSALAELQALDEKGKNHQAVSNGAKNAGDPLLENGSPAALAELQAQGRTATERLHGTRPRIASFRERQMSGRDGINREGTRLQAP